MEGLLLVWINEKLMAGDSVGEAIICEKTKQLLEEVGAKAPSTSTGPVKEFFFGTKGWFTGFTKKYWITQCCEAW
jgi:Tc5 transposase DNA-binding domain.